MAAPGPAPNPQRVNIVLTKSDDENSIIVKPGKFHIHASPANGPVGVEWYCSNAFSIDFYSPNGSPFGNPGNPTLHCQCPTGGSIPSGPAGAVGNFKYVITIGENVLAADGQVDP
jgi:hypothetical protein